MTKLLYSGTFDPLTMGHLDIIERGSKLADELVVGIIRNPSKKPFFSEEARKEMIEEAVSHLSNVRVDVFEGLLADYARENGIDAILRGLRNSTDFDYEVPMAQINCKLLKGLETIFLMTDERYSFISSSMVRELYSLGADFKNQVPDSIYNYMMKNK